jgi:hypothetical protein
VKYLLDRNLNLKFASPYSFSKAEPKGLFIAETRSRKNLETAGQNLMMAGDESLIYQVYLESGRVGCRGNA